METNNRNKQNKNTKDIIFRQGDHYSVANYSGSLVNYLYKKMLNN